MSINDKLAMDNSFKKFLKEENHNVEPLRTNSKHSQKKKIHDHAERPL